MLTPDAVHVWRIPLSPPERDAASLWDRWRSVLSNEEQRKADGFVRETDRRDSMRAHAALRCVLGSCLGMAPAVVPIAPQPEGESARLWRGAASTKPALTPPSEPLASRPDLRFNLSHTRGAALVGVGVGFEVGVDIECERPLHDLDGMARSVMSPTELERWSALPPASRLRAFYRLWTRKESYLKAIGLGLSRSLQDVTVPVSAEELDDSGGRFFPVQDIAGQGIWVIRDVPVPDGYTASLCCEGGQLRRLTVEDLHLDGCEWRT